LATGVLVLGRWTVPEAPAPVPPDWPAAEELAALDPFAGPVAVRAPRGGEMGVRMRAGDDPFERSPSVAAPRLSGSAAPVPLRLTAVLITETRRTAVVNDRLVAPGDEVLPGWRVERVERDRVVLSGPGGERRALLLSRGDS
jgi:hypothetical protein